MIRKKGRNPNKFLTELETTREKETGKQSSLDHLVRYHTIEKKAGEATEGKKDRAPSQPNKK